MAFIFSRSWLVGSTILALSGTAYAANSTVRYAKAPSWALLPPAEAAATPSADEQMRVVYLDTDVRIGPNGEENYTAYRIKLLKPEALAAGNIAIVWDPSSGEAIVHHLLLVRDGTATDVLATSKFRILQREGALEQSMLDGQLTATLQIPGLQIGDEIEFAATVVRNEPSFGGHSAGVHQFPVLGTPGLFRNRLSWPERTSLTVRGTPDLAAGETTTVGGFKTMLHQLRNPVGAIPTEGAPSRFNVRRAVEYSDFSDWADVSRQFFPMFAKAGTVSASSPIRAEAAKIAASTADPAARALAALRLVEERVRYVYVGLDGANYVPASIDSTWQRRFGDCKAKTVLLLALLRELGVAAEPMLVASSGGDGLDERLPSPRLFDHVVVRATLGAKTILLDGTRLGDRSLESLPPSAYSWGLPLRPDGANVERIGPAGLAQPSFVGVVDIDASSGFDADAKVEARDIMRGDDAITMRSKISAMSAADVDRALRSYWRQQLDWVEPDSVSWTYDDQRAVLTLRQVGKGKLDWTGDEREGRKLTLIGAGFTPPSALKRPKEQNQSAPWMLEFPRFRCWATTVRFPAADKWGWDAEAKPMHRRLGGVEYWRASGLAGDQIRTVMSRRTLTPEISAADAIRLNGQIAAFNNNMSMLYQVPRKEAPKAAALPFGDNVDWAADPAPCSSTGSAS